MDELTASERIDSAFGYRPMTAEEKAEQRRRCALSMVLDLVRDGKVMPSAYEITHLAGEFTKFMEDGK